MPRLGPRLGPSLGLLLALLGIALGLGPFLPGGSALGVVAAALGIVPSGIALALALSARERALREERPLALPTATLSLAVAATLFCLVWLCGLLWTAATAGSRPPAPAAPAPRPARSGPSEGWT